MNALQPFVPPSLTSKTVAAATTAMKKVVRATSSDSLHKTLQEMRKFFEVFDSVVRAEFIRRAAKGTIRTETGTVQRATRHNYTFDGEKIDAFLKKHGIAPEKVYNYEYHVVTEDEAKLKRAMKDGVLVREKRISAEKFSALAEKFPKLLNFVVDEPTTYLKGL